MDAFPAFFPLTGATVVIAGEGHGAQAKSALLADSPARVVRLTGPAARDPHSYAGATLVFVASDDASFRTEAAAAARKAGAPVNVVDAPSLCDFHTPAVIDRGAVVVAVGTAGAAPILASLLRTEIESRLAPGLGALATVLGARRSGIRAAFPDLGRRRAFLRRVIDGPIAEKAGVDPVQAGVMLDEALGQAGDSQQGLVSLIVAGKAPDLISLRALRALAAADILVAPETCATLASLARRDVSRLSVAEASAARLAGLATDGRRISVILEGAADALAASIGEAGAAVEVHAPAPAP